MDPTRVLAHEIQASLLAIETRLHALRGRPDCGETLDACGRELSYLRSVVASVLGTEGPRPKLVSMAVGPVMRSVGERFRTVSGPAGATLRLAVPEPELTVSADPVRTERILTALVDNALKHSGSAGHVLMRARKRGSAVEVIVEDDGIGIPVEARESIFDPLRSGSETSGTGLGLAIARALAASQGAVLELLEPSGGPGARFTLRWSGA